LNGRLSSTNLICSACNGKFGDALEPEIKKFFKTIQFILYDGEIGKLKGKDLDGREILMSSASKIEITGKPQSSFNNVGNFSILNVSGNKKDAEKFFEKRKDELESKGYKLIETILEEVKEKAPTLNLNEEQEITPQIILEFNKIAVEFYAYKEYNLDLIKPITNSISEMNMALNNVVFCNFDEEIRKFRAKEISHLIVLKTNKKAELICYIELYNVICASIKLATNFSQDIEEVYYQDALTGQIINEKFSPNLDTIYNKEDLFYSFENLTNKLFNRKQERSFDTRLNEGLKFILKEVKDEFNDEEKINQEYLKRSCEYISYLTNYEFPYIREDLQPNEIEELNYIHSNIWSEKFQIFIESNANLIGLNFNEGNELYTLIEFVKQPCLEKRELVKVYGKLINPVTQDMKHIPYRVIFDSIVAFNTKK
jgi:hypothetical protein